MPKIKHVKYWSACAYLERIFATGFIAQHDNIRIPAGEFLSGSGFGFATPGETADSTFVRNPPMEKEEQLNLIPPSEVKECDTPQELMCKVCFDARIRALAMPCSHCFGCLSCTVKLFEKECPICRVLICKVNQIYII